MSQKSLSLENVNSLRTHGIESESYVLLQERLGFRDVDHNAIEC